MFATIKQIFAKDNKEIRKRILFTIGALALFSIGTNITVPGAKSITRELGFLQILNLMSGGGLKNFSIFALGVTPYITATIIMQLLQSDILPYFKELKEEGYTGRQKINRISRYLGIAFAFIQSYLFSIGFLNSSSTMVILKTSLIMTAGTAFLLWLGDQITTRGIGNGISLLIMAGIIQTMPSMFYKVYTSLITNGSNLAVGILLFALFVIIYLGIIIGIIFIQEAEERIPIQYSNRTNNAYKARQSYLPVKLNPSGVMPVILASTVLTIPTTIAEFVGKSGFKTFVNNYINYTTLTGAIIYVLLIFFFGYFWTFMQMNPKEMSKDLNERGAYLPSVRPGKETEQHIKYVLSRVNVSGLIFLTIIALIPIIFSKISALGSNVTVGGTGLLIVVGVALETFKQLESSLIARDYKRRSKRI